MRIILPILAACYSSLALCQQTQHSDSVNQFLIQRIEENNIETNILKSGILGDIYKNEIKRTGYTSEILKPLSVTEEKHLTDFLNDSLKVKAFYGEINNAISLTKRTWNFTVNDQGLCRKINPYVEFTYGSPIMGESMTNFLSPLLTKALDIYSRDMEKTFFENVNNFHELNSLVDVVIKKALKDNYPLYQANDVKKEITSFFLDKNIQLKSDYLELFFGKIIKRVEETRGNQLTGANIGINNLKRQLTAQANALTAAKKDGFVKLGDDMERLAHNEIDEVNNVINGWKSQIKNRKISIDSIEGITNHAPETIVKYAKLVEQNSVQTQILADYAQKGLNILKDYDKYKKQIEITYATSQTLLSDFNKFRDHPTFSSTVSFIQSGGTLASGVLNLIGDKEAAKNVAKFMTGLTGAIQIGTSIIPPNPMGIISGLGNIVSLFGGDQPDPHVEMMKQIQEGFQAMSGQLEKIEAKIDTLTSIVIRSHAETMRAMKILYTELEFIEKQGLAVLDLLSNQAYRPYRMMINDIATFNPKTASENGFLDWNHYSSTLGHWEAIAATRVFIKDDLSSLFEFCRLDLLSTETVWKPKQNDFDSLTTLLKKYYHSLNSPSFLGKTIIPADSFDVDFLLRYDQISVSQRLAWRDKRIASEFVARTSNSFLKVIPALILGREQYHQMTESIDTYLRATPQYGQIETGLANLLELQNCAISQEILSTGHPYMFKLYHSLFATNDVKLELAAIKSNKLLAMNLTAFILNQHFSKKNMAVFAGQTSKFKKTTNTDSLTRIKDKLNTLINPATLGHTKFIIDNNVGLALFYSQNNKDKLTLPIDQTDYILENKILYPSAFYELITQKQKTLTALYDLTLSEKLSDEHKNILKLLIRKRYI